MSSRISCSVFGEDDAFSVMVDDTQPVDVLKDKIMAKKKSLADLDPSELSLYQINILERDLKMCNDQLKNAVLLLHATALRKVYGPLDHLAKDTVHVLVVLRSE